MPRIARAVIEGIPYHVTQRGNRREDVFIDESCRQKYLAWLSDYSRKYGLKVWAYCLMTNHVHLIVVPQSKDSLESALRPLHMRYAQYVNNIMGWRGHLWQGRYFACPLDEKYLWAAVHYVERNPVRAGLVERAEDYPWSSAATHCGHNRDDILSSDFPPPGIIEDWRKWLHESDNPEDSDMLRQNTQRGLPCGSESFVSKLEKLFDRSLSFRPRGRPKREKK